MSAPDHSVRVPLTVSILVSIVGAAATAGVTWGIYSSRLDAIEASNKDLRQELKGQQADLRTQDRLLTTVNAQFAEILRRLESLEGRLDRSERNR